MNRIELKINRANERLEELQKSIEFFFDSKPYQVEAREELNGSIGYYLSKVDTHPVNINILAGEVLQNLRTVLDHIAFQIYIKGGKLSPVRSISFPIKESLMKFNEWKKKAPKEYSKNIITLFESIKPYKGGNNILWQLNELNNIDKHRLLVTAGGYFSGVDIYKHMMEEMRKISEFDIDIEDRSIIIKESNVNFPLTIGYHIFTDMVNKKPSLDWRFKFEIVIHEPNVIEGANIIELLRDMINEVKKVNTLFEPFY